MYGHNMPSTPPVSGRKPASITVLNPYILSPTSPRANAFSNLPSPHGLGIDRPNSMTPSVMDVAQLPTATDATADDAVLARLDFFTDSLTLNLGALSRFGNPFLVDVVASAILAVAVAEAKRGRRSRNRSQDNFEPPPPSSVLEKKEPSDAQAFKSSFVEGFHAWGGGKSKKSGSSSLGKWSRKASTTTGRSSKSDSLDKDIELAEWYGQPKTMQKENKAEQKRSKKKQEEGDQKEKLPFVTRSIINVLTFAFKTVVYVLRIAIKVVAGVVVMVTRNFSRL
jgi:hypothetical protein